MHGLVSSDLLEVLALLCLLVELLLGLQLVLAEAALQQVQAIAELLEPLPRLLLLGLRDARHVGTAVQSGFIRGRDFTRSKSGKRKLSTRRNKRNN